MIKIDDSCIVCGRCVAVCPAWILQMEDKAPTVINEKNCIFCDQCEAICSVGAFHHQTMPTKDETVNIKPELSITPEMAEQFLRSRRSCRNFKNKAVDRDTSMRLLSIGRYAQTSSNSQGVSFVVVENPETMEKLIEHTIRFYSKSEDKMVHKIYESFNGEAKKGIFRGAPMCIIALGAKVNPSAKISAQFALTYIEQFAPSLGVGTCWAGYFERYLNTDPKELRELLNVAGDKDFAKALLYGYPIFSGYKSLARRKPLSAEFV